jgi:hypothetical protein
VSEKLWMGSATLVLAMAMYAYVEKPFRENRQGFSDRLPGKKILFALVPLFVLLMAASWLVNSGNGWPWRYPARSREIAAEVKSEKSARFQQYAARCRADGCKSPARGVNVYIFGDSHAVDVFNVLIGIHPEYNYVMMAASGCKVLARQDYHEMDSQMVSRRDRDQCVEMNEQRLYRDQLRDANLIVINQVFNWYRPEHLENAIRQIRLKTTAPIVVFGNYLIFSRDFPSMVIWHHSLLLDKYYESRLAEHTFAYEDALRKLARRLQFTYISKRESFCGDQSLSSCRIVFDGKLFTYDESHLSVAADAALGEVLRQRYRDVFALRVPFGPGPSGPPAASTARHGSESGDDLSLWLEPSAMSACEKNGRVAIHWNLSRLASVSADIFVRDRQGHEKLFARVAGDGSKQTGPWMVSGDEVFLLDSANRRELARVALSGRPCPISSH